MTLTPQQLRALRKRRQAADAEAEWTFQERVVGPLTGADATALPPPVPVGWMESGHVGGGLLYCSQCCPLQPTSGHVPVYHQSLFATRCCCICSERLDHSTV